MFLRESIRAAGTGAPALPDIRTIPPLAVMNHWASKGERVAAGTWACPTAYSMVTAGSFYPGKFSGGPNSRVDRQIRGGWLGWKDAPKTPGRALRFAPTCNRGVYVSSPHRNGRQTAVQPGQPRQFCRGGLDAAAASVIALAVLLSSCSGQPGSSSNDTPPPAPPAESVAENPAPVVPGGALNVPDGAVPEGVEVQTFTGGAPELPTDAISVADPIDLTTSTGQQPDGPVTLSYPYDPAEVPEGIDPADIYGIGTYNEQTQTWEPLPVTFDPDTPPVELLAASVATSSETESTEGTATEQLDPISAAPVGQTLAEVASDTAPMVEAWADVDPTSLGTMSAELDSFSWKWPSFWPADDVATATAQLIGEIAGKRVPGPECTSENTRVPAWAVPNVDDTDGAALRTCAEADPADPDRLVIQIVNNRSYGQVLELPVAPAFSYVEAPDDPGALFVKKVMDAGHDEVSPAPEEGQVDAATATALYLPPLSKASVGFDRDSFAPGDTNVTFEADLTYDSIALEYMSYSLSALLEAPVLERMVGPFIAACGASLTEVPEEGEAYATDFDLGDGRDWVLSSAPCLQKALDVGVKAKVLDGRKGSQVKMVHQALGRAGVYAAVWSAANDAADLIVDQALIPGSHIFSVRVKAGPRFPATETQAQPFLGTWTGPVDQPSSSVRYSVEATVSWNPQEDRLVTTVAYPELECAGKWVRGWIDASGRLRSEEIITQQTPSRRPYNCIDTNITLTPPDPGAPLRSAAPGSMGYQCGGGFITGRCVGNLTRQGGVQPAQPTPLD